jgi:hypothetical protein
MQPELYEGEGMASLKETILKRWPSAVISHSWYPGHNHPGLAGMKYKDSDGKIYYSCGHFTITNEGEQVAKIIIYIDNF